jgi:acyl-CoA thioester hydrolase
MALSEFVYTRRVQYKETDASGLVHFTAFFSYAEEAEHAMWREAGVSVEPERTDIGWPRVSASFDFRRPLRFEDEIEVRLRLVGRTAKTLTYQTVVTKAGTIAAIGQHTSICVRKQPGTPIKAIDIPEEIASRFEVVPPI